MLMLKIALSPALVGAASWISRRWGATAGGWFSSLPLTSGPVMFVMTLERGPAFAAQASLGTLLAIVSLAAFALAYSWLAHHAIRRAARGSESERGSGSRSDAGGERGSWMRCSAAGCIAYLACTGMLHDASVSLPIAFAIACVALLITLRALHATPPPASGGAAAARPISMPVPMPPPMSMSTATSAAAAVVWWDIPLRMMLAAALVFTLTRIASALGPRLSGLLTPFPIALTILAAFTHHFDGAAAATRLLRGFVGGLFSFAMFFLVAGLAVTRWPPVLTFAAATIGALAWHALAGMWKGGLRAAAATVAGVVHRRRMARGV